MQLSKYKIVGTLSLLLIGAVSKAQEVSRTIEYDPHQNKIIPDKIIEIGVPLLVIFLIATSIVNVLKARAENRLKEKALDKQLSDETLIALFSEDKAAKKYVYLKWFLVTAAVGVALIYLHIMAQFVKMQSGYLSLGVISICLSISFLIYYRIIRNK